MRRRIYVRFLAPEAPPLLAFPPVSGMRQSVVIGGSHAALWRLDREARWRPLLQVAHSSRALSGYSSRFAHSGLRRHLRAIRRSVLLAPLPVERIRPGARH